MQMKPEGVTTKMKALDEHIVAVTFFVIFTEESNKIKKSIIYLLN